MPGGRDDVWAPRRNRRAILIRQNRGGNADESFLGRPDGASASPVDEPTRLASVSRERCWWIGRYFPWYGLESSLTRPAPGPYA